MEFVTAIGGDAVLGDVNDIHANGALAFVAHFEGSLILVN